MPNNQSLDQIKTEIMSIFFILSNFDKLKNQINRADTKQALRIKLYERTFPNVSSKSL